MAFILCEYTHACTHIHTYIHTYTHCFKKPGKSAKGWYTPGLINTCNYCMGSNFKISCFLVSFNLEIFVGIIFCWCCILCMHLKYRNYTVFFCNQSENQRSPYIQGNIGISLFFSSLLHLVHMLGQ